MYFQLEGARVNYETQGYCSIDMPEGADITDTKEYPLVVAVHGSNRGAVDYDECPFYAEQKKIALKKGCVFGVISNKLDTWGRDDGLFNLVLFIRHIIANYPVRKKAILWATSAGGTLACRAVSEYPELVELVIGTFPVYDLESTYGLKTCRVAWRAKDENMFRTAIEGKNPCRFYENLKGCNFFVTHGTADSAVPYTQNALRMKNDLGDKMYLETIEGGVHSTQNFDFYGKAVDLAFASVGI